MLYIRNRGAENLNANSLNFYVNNVLVESNSIVIAPGTVGTIALNDSKLAMLPDPAELKVTSAGFSDKITADFYGRYTAGYWKFDEGSGSTAMDSNGNNGQLGPACPDCPVWQPSGNCKHGQCLLLDGNNDFITATDTPSLSPSSAITIEVWVKLNAAGGYWQPISFKEGPEGRAWWYGFFPGRADRIHWSNGGLSIWDLSCDIPSALNTWRHIVVTYQSGGVGRKMYVDGALVCSDTATGNLVDASGNLYIGGGGWQPINGNMDEVRILNVARSMTTA